MIDWPKNDLAAARKENASHQRQDQVAELTVQSQLALVNHC